MGRAGLSLGSVQRSVDYSAFTFGDQIARNSGSSVEGFGDGRAVYFDVGTGILVYTEKEWLGVAVSHLNRPNQSLLDNTSPLPTEFKVHGGYKLTLAEHESTNKKIPYVNLLTLAFNYKHQRKFNQLDLGAYYTKNWLVLGAWYRGIPLSKPNGKDINNDAAVFLIGFNFGTYKFGYSYDYTISKLSNLNSKGSHEISMAYQLCSFKKSKKRKNILISCPKF